MDPDETLTRLRRWAELQASETPDYEPDPFEAADLFAALDKWMTTGGFPPEPWQQAKSSQNKVSPLP